MLLDIFKPSRALAPKRLADRLAAIVAAAAIVPEPAPYIFIENVFPDDLYGEILRHFALTAPFFKEKVHRIDPQRYFGSYPERMEILLQELLGRCPSAEFWEGLFRELKSRVFFTAVMEKFRPGFEARFGAAAVTPALRDQLDRTLLLAHHRPGFFVGPHTDQRRKVVTFIFNCAERPGLEHLGTAMYRPKQKGFTSDGQEHCDPVLFERIHLSPYRPNSALIFFRHDALFHGVELLTAENLQGSNRPNIQFNLWQS